MINNVKKMEELLEFTIESNIFNKAVLKDSLSDNEIKYLSKYFNYVSLENEDVDIELWLKSKLYESIITSHGLKKYLRDLLNYKDEYPEKEVDMNLYITYMHIISSLNPFLLEIISILRNKNVISMSNDEFNALKKILKPSKNFTVNSKNIYFKSFEIENYRDEILRYSLDILNTIEYGIDERKRLEALKLEQEYIITKIPRDLKYIKNIDYFSLDRIVKISNEKKLLKISLIDGYLIWKFKNKPAIFIKNNQMYFSSKRSKHSETTTKRSATMQANIVIKTLVEKKGSKTLCNLCHINYTNMLAYDENFGIIPVCANCFKKDSVIGKVGEIKSKM